jgi:HEAT repeat protein
MDEYSRQFKNDFIKQIGLGIHISKTYPKGHPSLQPVVQRLRILLKEMPIEQESLSCVIIEDVIMIGEDRFDSKNLPLIKSLVKRFDQLGVKSITINVDTSEDDIKEFFTAMAATPADISDYGDIVALMHARGVVGIQVNKFRVGVVATDQEAQVLNWEQFLESFTLGQPAMSEEDRVKELSSFLAGLGLAGSEAAEVQTSKIAAGLEKLALVIADQYGEDRWDEYSMVFSRMLSALSPNIKKNIVRFKTENRKLAMLFKNLMPTMDDEDIIDIITQKAKEKSPGTEQEIIDILKNVTGSRLPGILSTLRVNVPQLDFETIVSRLMTEMKSVKGEKAADKFLAKNLETEMRSIFPRLRDSSEGVRIKAIGELMKYVDRVFEKENHDLVRLLVDRFDTMADAETNITTFGHIIEALKALYFKSQELKLDDLVRFISKKFSKHLLRKDIALVEKKKAVIRTIADIKDESYVPELVSLLWDPGTFAEAREALIALSEYSVPLLISTLKETEDRGVRMKIIDVLKRTGEKTIPEIVKMLSDPEWYIRRNGVYILGEIIAVSTVDDIGSLLDDEVEQVQTEVVDSMVKIGGDKARDYIKKALKSTYRSVVLEAMVNLETADVKDMLPEVAAWLSSRKGIPSSKEEVFRRRVIDVLTRFGGDEIVDNLVSLLSEKALFKGDLLLPTKESALNALAKIGTEKAMAALKEAAQHKDNFVAATAEEILRRYEGTT